MSTILDVLKKVERERQSPEGALPAPSQPSELSRRRVPSRAVVACVVVGFSVGGVLSWWLAKEPPPSEVAALPAAVPPPAIPIPPAPVVARHKVPPANAPAEQVAGGEVAPVESVVGAPAPAAPAAAVGSAANQAVAAAPAPPAANPAGAGTTVVSPPASEGQTTTLAKADGRATALEPSPFAAPREAATENAAAGDRGDAESAMRRPEKAAPTAPEVVAAVPPAPPTTAAEPEAPVEPAPQVEQEAAPEPAPQPSPEVLVDTGRSPTGAPKVSLSFLQWSADPEKRFAFVSIDGAPSQRVREGDGVNGMTVGPITPTGVQFKREGTSFIIRPRH